MKRCTACNKSKPESAFRSRRGGLTRQCAPCLDRAHVYNTRRRRAAGVKPATSAAENFLDRIAVEGDCWIWTGPRAGADRRYGRVEVDGIKLAAHRYSYALHFGDLSDAQVCHTCDNPLCVNPAHLYLGDTVTNMRDRTARGRSGPRGVRLNPDLVRRLRHEHQSGATQRALSIKYEIPTPTIHNAVTGKTWRNVA